MSFFLWSQLQKLPDDIIREYILPYTYRPQSPKLCADIRSFYKTYSNMCEIYKLIYPLHEESKEWLSSDIARFFNDDFIIRYGYRLFYINTYRRIFMNRNKDVENIIRCIQKTESELSPNDIKMHIGILTPHERQHLEDFLMDTTFPDRQHLEDF